MAKSHEDLHAQSIKQKFVGGHFETLSREQKKQLMIAATKFVAEKFGCWQSVLD